MRHTLLALALLPGCILDRPLGPDVGACAEYPEGSYTYGEIGIGTCLAGPTDLRFVDTEAGTFLAVTNGDPFRNFSGGSVLLIDWDSVDTSRGRVPMDELVAGSLPTDLYLGQIGVRDDLLLVPSKFSPDSRTVAAFDEVIAVDISDPLAPTERERVEVRQDPHPIAVDPASGRAYAVNVTGRSVSMLELGADGLEVLPVSEGASVSPARFFDGDASGSDAEIGLTSVLNPAAVPDETFTLTWIDVAQRAWLPAAGGVELWTSGGADWLPHPADIVLEPTEGGPFAAIEDPAFASVEGFLSLHFADEGDLLAAVSDYGPTDFSPAGVTTVLASDAPGSAQGWLSGPTILTFRGQTQLWYDARPAEGEPASIAKAVLNSSGIWERGEIHIAPPAGYLSVEDPAVWPDPQTDGMRVWASLWDGAQWSIGLTESADSELFTPVEEVLRLDGWHAAAPVIGWANGRYLMTLSVSDGASWSFATAWSYDGRSWSDPEIFASSADAFDPSRPPRAAVSTDVQGFFRVEGDDLGLIENPATAGGNWVSSGAGFAMRVSTGHALGLDTLGRESALGIEPASSLTVDGEQLVYALATDSAGRTGLAVLERTEQGFLIRSERAVDARGDVDGAVVVPDGESGYTLYFGDRDAEGVTRLRRASSADALSFAAEPGNLLDDGTEFDSFAQIPHAVHDDGEGRVLWFSGSDGDRYRIGAVRLDGLERVPGVSRDWQLGPGLPGEFDDTGVRDPVVFAVEDELHMLYTGLDGETSRLGHARLEGGSWVREPHPVTDQPSPVLLPVSRSFSHGGVSRPVLLDQQGEELLLAYTGHDGASPRLGLAVGTPEQLFGAHAFPTAGDMLVFSTTRGGPARKYIELGQVTDGFTTTGAGATNARIDEERGFLYVPTRDNPHLIVLDIRDDSSGDFVDGNVHDIEAVLRYTSTAGARGFRDALPRPGTDLLYATASSPDGVLVYDLAQVVDDSAKQALDRAVLWSFPQARAPQNDPNRPLQDEDEGAESLSAITGAGMAMSADGRLLLTTHARGNRLYVYDLALGAYGEEIRAIEGVGEFPHTVRISPDGRYAVVANYVGEYTDTGAQGTLAIVDLDPASPTYLEVVTRLVNQ